jgi:hypothetical protein
MAVPEFERGGIDEGLEGRAGLPLGLDRAVELPGDALEARGRPPSRAPRRRPTSRRWRPAPPEPSRTFSSKIRATAASAALDRGIEGGADDHVLGGLAGQEGRPRIHHPVGEIAAGARLGRRGQLGGVGAGEAAVTASR